MSPLHPIQPIIQTLLVSKIRTDGGTQARVLGLDQDYCRELADLLAAGVELPIVIVFWDSRHHWLGDGFSRCEAHRLAGPKFRHIFADVRQGTRRDAILFACGANASHGLRRTNADKHHAVEIMLADKEWRDWPNRRIADQCGVDEGLVRKIRREQYCAPDNNGQTSSADNPQTQPVDNSPPEALVAAFNALSPEKKLALLERQEEELEKERQQAPPETTWAERKKQALRQLGSAGRVIEGFGRRGKKPLGLLGKVVSSVQTLQEA